MNGRKQPEAYFSLLETSQNVHVCTQVRQIRSLNLARDAGYFPLGAPLGTHGAPVTSLPPQSEATDRVYGMQ